MKIHLQDYRHKDPIFVTPQTTITCQECRKPSLIKGDEPIEMDYDNVLESDAVEDSLETKMSELGWIDMTCPMCMSFRKKHSS
jgi:hypothetical protein